MSPQILEGGYRVSSYCPEKGCARTMAMKAGQSSQSFVRMGCDDDGGSNEPPFGAEYLNIGVEAMWQGWWWWYGAYDGDNGKRKKRIHERLRSILEQLPFSDNSDRKLIGIFQGKQIILQVHGSTVVAFTQNFSRYQFSQRTRSVLERIKNIQEIIRYKYVFLGREEFSIVFPRSLDNEGSDSLCSLTSEQWWNTKVWLELSPMGIPQLLDGWAQPKVNDSLDTTSTPTITTLV